MERDDAERLAEWLEVASTTIDAGALPELEIETDTIARCARCLRPVKIGGDAARPTFEKMAENAPDECWRSMSGA